MKLEEISSTGGVDALVGSSLIPFERKCRARIIKAYSLVKPATPCN